MRLRAAICLVLALAAPVGAAEPAPPVGAAEPAPPVGAAEPAPPVGAAEPAPPPPDCSARASDRPPDPRCGETLDGRSTPSPPADLAVPRAVLWGPRLASRVVFWPVVKTSDAFEYYQ